MPPARFDPTPSVKAQRAAFRVPPAARNERRTRALLIHWIASGAVIDEAERAGPLDEQELAALAEAVEAARRAGR